jgi:glycosyltransferase involved in cell wall biosynthesis
MLGWLDEPGLRKALSDVAAVTVPSTWFENAPLAVLEPMSLGLPVVASAIGGITEMIESGTDGLLVNPHDAQELAQALRSLIDDPEFAARIGSAARAKSTTVYSPSRHTAALVDLYKSVAAPARSGRKEGS